MTPPDRAPEPLSAESARALTEFSLYRKTARTLISDRTFPPGTIYATPEGLRAEDEATRAALDVQGGIYPIRESVFTATYVLDAARDPRPVGEGLDVLAAKIAKDWNGRELDTAWAVAEHALPEGMRIDLLAWPTREDDEWVVRATGAGRIEKATGPTPAAALCALAERLSTDQPASTEAGEDG